MNCGEVVLALLVRHKADYMPVRQDEIEMALLGQLGCRLQAKLYRDVRFLRGSFRLIKELFPDVDADHAIAALCELDGVSADSARDLQDIERRIQADEILEHIHVFGACVDVGETDVLRNDLLAILFLPRTPYDLSFHRHGFIPLARTFHHTMHKTRKMHEALPGSRNRRWAVRQLLCCAS
jgi:hypothetical protein